MLAKEATFTPSHQPKHVKFTDTVQESSTSTQHNLQEEVAMPPKPAFQSHPEETVLHVAAQQSQKMPELKISKLKGGYNSSAGLLFQSWLKDIYAHVEDRWLIQSEAIKLVKDFTTKLVQDETSFTWA